jgi:hypothetical protein
MATKKATKKASAMNGIDWATQPGPAGIDKIKQKPMMIGFLTVVTNKHFSNKKIPLANYVPKVGAAAMPAATVSAGVASAVTLRPGQDHIDMSQVYTKLKPLTTDDVNGLVVLARSNSTSFSAMADAFWNQVSGGLHYPIGDESCPAASDSLALNN